MNRPCSWHSCCRSKMFLTSWIITLNRSLWSCWALGTVCSVIAKKKIEPLQKQSGVWSFRVGPWTAGLPLDVEKGSCKAAQARALVRGTAPQSEEPVGSLQPCWNSHRFIVTEVKVLKSSYCHNDAANNISVEPNFQVWKGSSFSENSGCCESNGMEHSTGSRSHGRAAWSVWDHLGSSSVSSKG